MGAANAAYVAVDSVSVGDAIFADRTAAQFSFGSNLGFLDASTTAGTTEGYPNARSIVFVKAFAADKSLSMNSLRASLAAADYGQVKGVKVYLQFPIFYSEGVVSVGSSPNAGPVPLGASARYNVQSRCPWLASESWSLDSSVGGPTISVNSGSSSSGPGAVFSKVFPASQTIQLKACNSLSMTKKITFIMINNECHIDHDLVEQLEEHPGKISKCT